LSTFENVIESEWPSPLGENGKFRPGLRFGLKFLQTKYEDKQRNRLRPDTLPYANGSGRMLELHQ